MANEEMCPICGKDCSIEPTEQIGYNIVRCHKDCFTFWISDSVNYGNERTIRQRYNVIYEYLITHEMINKHYYRFFYEQSYVMKDTDPPIYINVADLIKNYPQSIAEKFDRILLNIARKYPNIGEIFDFLKLPPTMLFMETALSNIMDYMGQEKQLLPKIVLPDNPKAKDIRNSINELNALAGYLCDLGYLQKKTFGEPNTQYLYILTVRAWEHIGELTRKQKEINQGFIAMSFRNETKAISDCFKTAIQACGYIPKRIDEKEHNNQIVPEILFEISQSKFVVVDVTYQNFGAYYEAGYAQALGKQVIICCRKTEFDDPSKRPHFDISQKSMIVWTDESDLTERLKKRIIATVGGNE